MWINDLYMVVLDILLTGTDSTNTPIAKVYRNIGGGFVDMQAGRTGVHQGSIAWGNYGAPVTHMVPQSRYCRAWQCRTHSRGERPFTSE